MIERYQPVIFNDCGCRLDLCDDKHYEVTPCDFHVNIIVKKSTDLMIFGRDMSEEKLR